MNPLSKTGILLFILACNFSATYSQLCTGSLGDPIVNITFGSGTGFGAPLNGQTNYSYIAADCPNDGYYTVAGSTSNCFGFTWHVVTEDHTPGDVNGYMMIVNASYNPGDFFVKTVSGLCPNTTYEFAAWIMTVVKNTACVNKPILPNVTFSIETTTGTVLQSYKTGDIPATGTPIWKQFGFFFTTSTAGSVVIRMTNNAPGGCGNDLLLDDITFRPCGPLVTAGIAGYPDSVDICQGNNSVFTLNANVSAGYTDPVYQWQVSTDSGNTWNNIAGATGKTYIRQPVMSPAKYLYRFAVSERINQGISTCAIHSNILSIGVNGLPVTAASNHGNCIGDTLFLTANDASVFTWTGPNNFSSNSQSPYIPNASTQNSGTYYVTVVSSKGCTSKDSTIVLISPKPSVKVGNDTSVCAGKSVQLHSSGVNISSWQWSPVRGISDPNMANPIASPAQTTLYKLTVANGKCTISDSLLIVVYKNPIADAGPDKVIIKGQSAILNGTAAGSEITFFWTPSDFMNNTSTLTPVTTPPSDLVYTLHVISNKGCGTATDNVLVKVYGQLYIPNAFSPNNDGLNDTWYPIPLDAFPGASLKVYNRYGQMVFDNNGTSKPWDGKFKGQLLPEGAYVYVIDLKNNSPVIKGVVIIMR